MSQEVVYARADRSAALTASSGPSRNPLHRFQSIGCHGTVGHPHCRLPRTTGSGRSETVMNNRSAAAQSMPRSIRRISREIRLFEPHFERHTDRNGRS